MQLLSIVVVIFVSAGIGLGVNYFSLKERGEKESASVAQVLSGTGLIAAFLLAIVITGASESYSAAQQASKEEADIIDTLYESAGYVQEPFQQRIRAAAVCYARAVVGPEWKTLANGKSSPVPSNWTGTKPTGMRAVFLEMTTDAPGFDLVQGADSERGSLRSARVRQANPTVPGAVIWFMVILISLALGGLAYEIPRTGNTGHLLALAVVILTFLGAMGLIWNLDRPFTSVLALKPAAMQITADDDGADYVEQYQVQPPCDDEGNPRAEAAAALVGGTATTTTTTPTPPTTVRR